MLCLRCTKRIALTPSLLRSTPSPLLAQTPLRATTASPSLQSRPLSFLTAFTNPTSSFRLLKRPSLPTTPTSTLSLTTTLDNNAAATTTALSASGTSVSPPGGLLQVRGPKRDTFNPSHRVRKRRHGFLARLRSRTGRALLKRRLAKKRSTLSH